MQSVQEFAAQLVENVERVIIGKRGTIELVLVALLCEGHVLLEDVPGIGKTMLARSLAVSLGGAFKRLQCTPDLLPNDVTGVSVFNQRSERVRVPSRARSLSTFCWQMRSTAPRRAPSRPCSRRCRSSR